MTLRFSADIDEKVRSCSVRGRFPLPAATRDR